MTHLRESVAQLILSIQANRAVPKYQFERASEPFLAMFLAEALESAGYGRLEYLAPEFPLKKRSSRQSTNVDHTLKSENGDWLLVEIKTEVEPPREAQMEAYRAARGKSVQQLVDDLDVILCKSRKKEKYRALMSLIAKSGPHQGVAGLLYISPHRRKPVPERATYDRLVLARFAFRKLSVSDAPRALGVDRSLVSFDSGLSPITCRSSRSLHSLGLPALQVTA